MTEQVGAGLVAQVVTYLGSTPILLFFAVVILFPTAVQIWANYKQDKRLAQVIKMYETNVKLVENYESLTASMQKVLEDQQDLIILITGTMQTLVDHIKNNLYCPLMRPPERAGRAEDKRG